jgi:membrane associated rhomboid family serine protease
VFGGRRGKRVAARTKMPVVTATVTALTAVLTGVAFAHPSLVHAIQRSPAMLADHQWWRIVSPVLVNPEGWRQVVVNTGGLVVIGTAVERLWGPRLWVAFYLTGAVLGEIAGLAWRPFGAGSSVAVSGLLGALAVALWYRVGTVPARVGGSVVVGMGIVLSIAHDLHGPPIAGAAVLALLLRGRMAACGGRRVG